MRSLIFLKRLFKIPEVQFFLIFFIPFTGFFIIHYLFLEERYRFIAVVSLVGSLAVVLMQTIYSVVAHLRVEKEEDEFLQTTAHQLKTPLTAVRWALQEFSHSGIKEAERVELAKVAVAASDKLGNAINVFEQLATLHRGGNIGSPETIEIVGFINKLVQASEIIARQFGVTVSAEKPEETLYVEADPIALEVAIVNLINNGIKYNRRGGVVNILVRRLVADNLVEIDIDDTGVGISEVDQKRIFGKYCRTTEAKKINPDGTGLGLFLTKTIIEAHGGRILVESIVGRGSMFRVILPLAK